MSGNEVKRKIKSFTDLDTWREGHKFVVLIYKMTGEKMTTVLHNSPFTIQYSASGKGAIK